MFRKNGLTCLEEHTHDLDHKDKDCEDKDCEALNDWKEMKETFEINFASLKEQAK